MFTAAPVIMVRSVLFLSAFAILATEACKKKDQPTSENPDDPALLAQDGADTSAVETDNEVLTSSLVTSSAAGGLTLASSGDLEGGELYPADIGDTAKAFFFPRGCLVVKNDAVAKTATYTFDGCSGPNGLLKVTGELKVSYQVNGNTLVLDLVGTGLKVRGATADYSAHGEITANGLQRQMTWSASLSGTTARGRDFTRTNKKTVSWTVGEKCFALSGESEGDVKGRKLKTVITDYSRCAGSCPEAGGKITITNETTGTTVEIDFDGTDRATFSSTKVQPTKFPLMCL